MEDNIPNPEMVCIALKGFTKGWEVFVTCVVGREKFLDWSKFLDDFTHEEILRGFQKQEDEEEEENIALPSRFKGKGKKGEGPSSGIERKDMSKIQCFSC